MTFIRFVSTLALALWVGSIFFFGAVLAPTVFKVLPTHTLAGMVVSRSLLVLHIIGFVCGLVFVLTAMLTSVTPLERRGHGIGVLLALVMIAITAASQFGISSKMNRLRTDMGNIDALSVSDERRVEFNRLHKYSTVMEESVFVLGLAVLYTTSRRLS